MPLPLPISLANTLAARAGQPHDMLQTPADLARWLAANADHFPEPVRAAAADQLQAFRTLRTALRELFRASAEGTPPPPAAIGLLNELSAQAPQFARLEWLTDRPQRTFIELAEPRAVALAIVARAGIELLAGPDRQRIGVCGAPGCVLVFLKARPHSQWCSAACGNRARVARHHRRHRRGAAYTGAP